jgi:hypothetical protein
MATITLTRGGDLPDSAAKADFHNLVDTATVAASAIVNADISTSAAIADTKLAAITTATKVNTSALTTTSMAAGDILYNNGTNWIRLAVGTAGQYLKVAAGATALEWGA